MSDSVDEPQLSISAVPGASDFPLSEYTDEDVPTHLVEALSFEPRWLVQVTTFDRRMMDTEQVLAALDASLVRHDTLVWRGGMDDWQPLARAFSLEGSERLTLPPVARRMSLASAARTTLPPRERPQPARADQPTALAALLASVAIVVSIAAVTTSALAVGGVFEAAPSAPALRVAR
jgi:hypothetical protein